MGGSDKIRCEACPVMCFIAEGRAGACDRYANEAGRIIRCDPVTIINKTLKAGGAIKPFLKSDRDGENFTGDELTVTAVGAGTTYPDYKPAPFIIASQIDGADFITVVSEAIFSYCGVKIKIDTDRHIGNECDIVRADGEAVGHVMTSEYGSQMLSLGGVDHLTGGSKREGNVTCDTLMNLCNRQPVRLAIDNGSTIIIEAGQPPIIDGRREERMRVGCGSATIGMFASQWLGLVDEVVVVDDHITGVVSEHQAGKVLGWQPSGIKINGRRSTPGRYFQVAEPGLSWGGTNIEDPLVILGDFNARKGARPGMTILMVSTTGEQSAYYVLDDDLQPVKHDLPESLEASVELISENCEPSVCSIMFMAGAGGSLRSGVTKNPVKLTRSVKHSQTRLTCGGAQAFVWPGGGITIMVDVMEMPECSFGYVPTPAIVAPIEFTMPYQLYLELGGHMDAVRQLDDVLCNGGEYGDSFQMLPAAKRQ